MFMMNYVYTFLRFPLFTFIFLYVFALLII